MAEKWWEKAPRAGSEDRQRPRAWSDIPGYDATTPQPRESEAPQGDGEKWWQSAPLAEQGGSAPRGTAAAPAGAPQAPEARSTPTPPEETRTPSLADLMAPPDAARGARRDRRALRDPGSGLAVPPVSPQPQPGAKPQQPQAAGPDDDQRAARGFARAPYLDGLVDAPNAPASPVSRIAETMQPDGPERPRQPLSDFGQRIARGVTNIPASFPETAAVAAAEGAEARSEDMLGGIANRAQQIEDIRARLARGDLSEEEKRLRERQLADLTTGQGRLAEEQRRASERAEIPASERGVYQAGEAIRQTSLDLFGTPDPQFDERFVSKLAEGAGSFAGFIGTALLTGPAGAAGAGSAVNSSGMYRRARSEGANEDEARTAAYIGSVVGLSEALPISRALRQLPSGLRERAASAFGRRLSNAFISGGEEAVQEGGVGILNNLTAKGVYNPEQGAFENVGEDALIGAILGAPLGALAPTGERSGRPATPSAGPTADRGPRPDSEGDEPRRGADTPPQVQGTPPGQPQAGVPPQSGVNATRTPDATADTGQGPLPTDRLSPTPPQTPQPDGAPNRPAPSSPSSQREAEGRPEAAGEQPPGGRIEIMDEVETDSETGERRPTGRRLQVNLDTGEASPVEADASAGAAQGQSPEGDASGVDAAPAAGPQGAPEGTPADAEATGQAEGEIRRAPAPQAEDTAVTPTGREVPVEYAVVDAGDLVPSNLDDGRVNPAFPTDLQPRDRTRPASQEQVRGMAQNLDPRLLMRSPTATDGAPIVDASGVVESGNGRVMALRRAYAESPQAAQRYREALEAEGMPTEGFQNPVLVRVRRGQMTPEDRAAFTREANQRTTSAMSATEQAMADAEAMPDAILPLYRGGDVDAAQNRDFVRRFLDAAVGEGDRAQMIDRSGQMSQEAVRRVQAALLARAYGDPDLVAALVESADTNIKAIGGALLDVAPEWAQMRAEAAQGTIAPEVDQTAALLEAVRVVDRARRARRNVAEFVGQGDMLAGGDTISEMGQEFLALFFRDRVQWTKPAGREKMADALRFYVTEAQKTAPGVDMFGASADPQATVRRAQERQYGDQEQGQGDLLAGPPDGGDGASPRPGGTGQGSDAGGASGGQAEGQQGAPRGEGDAGRQDAAQVSPGPGSGARPGEYVDRSGGQRGDDLFTDLSAEWGAVPEAQIAEEARRRVLEPGRDEGVEYSVLIDGRGQIVAYGRGHETGTGVSGAMRALSSDPEADLVVHHNHPSSNAFSPADYVEGMSLGYRGVYAHAHDGTSLLFESTDLGRRVRNEVSDFDARLKRAFNRMFTSARPAMERLVAAGVYQTDSAGRTKEPGRDRSYAFMAAMQEVGLIRAEVSGNPRREGGDRENPYFTDPEMRRLYRNLVANLRRIISMAPEDSRYDRPARDGRHPGLLAGVPGRNEEGARQPARGEAPENVRAGDQERGAGDRAEDARGNVTGDADFDAALDTMFGPGADSAPASAATRPERTDAPRGERDAIPLTPPPARRAASGAGGGKRSKAAIAKDIKGAIKGLKEGSDVLPAGLNRETYDELAPLFFEALDNDPRGRNRQEVFAEMMRPLVEAGVTRDEAVILKPYFDRFLEDVEAGRISFPEGAPDDTAASGGLERDRGDAGSDDGVGSGDVSAAAGDDGQGDRAGGSRADQGDGRRQAGRGGARRGAPGVGGRGGSAVRQQRAPAQSRADGDGDRAGSGDRREPGLRPDDSGAEVTRKEAADSSERVKADPKALPSEHHKEIARAVPALRPEQVDDVVRIEQRFHRPPNGRTTGHGILITNGTGTGKTMTGLGAVKRAVDSGAEGVLVIVKTQGEVENWKRHGPLVDVDVEALADTNDNGGTATVVVTTYANAGDNRTLADRQWDLVIADESHMLSQNKAGDQTKPLRTLRAITNKPSHLFEAELMRRRADLDKARATKDQEARAEALSRIFEEARKAAREAEGNVKRANVVFMSATPFAYDTTTDYGEGYLFDYPKEQVREGSRQSGRNWFMVENFGYRIRYHRLTQPEAAVDQGVFHRQFHERLKRDGALWGRKLDIEADYDRKFVAVENELGKKIDDALKALDDKASEARAAERTAREGGANESAMAKASETRRGWEDLQKAVRRSFSYLKRMQLLEAMKAETAIPDIEAHIALGRKVVVFHDFNVGGATSPFKAAALDLTDDSRAALAELHRNLPWLKDLDFGRLDAPKEQILKRFGAQAVEYNGTISKKQREAAKDAFNNDDSDVRVIVVQSDAGSGGISLHDTTGAHQRALVNLGMPTKPTTTLQAEGRIRRVGAVSNAPYRYYTIGTTWERSAFAARIAAQSGAVENLAMGDEARAIRESFIDAYENAAPTRPSESDGTGGKEADRREGGISDFEKAKTHYFGRPKMKGKRDQRAGIDFFPTPEPLALKMVEWARIRPYEKVLEPSAGDGAIARYLPTDADRTVVEPSADLASRAQLLAPGSRVVEDLFENLNRVNKYDVVVMNPPFGSGGKTAIEHLDKAFRHTRDGGRVVALIPTGPMADKRFDQWKDSLYGDKTEPSHPFVSETYTLPQVTFERAGTAASARVVVIDKLPAKRSSDLTAEWLAQNGRPGDWQIGGGNIGAFFDRIEDLGGPRRFELGGPTGVEADMDATPAATDPDASNEAVSGVDLFQFTHTRTGEPKFGAAMQARMSRERYQAVKEVAQQHDGYWLAAKVARTVPGAKPGFVFPSEESRRAFMADLGAQGGLREDAPGFREEHEVPYGRPEDIFYSPLLRFLEGAKQKQAPAKDWKAILSKAPGVKKAEMDWLGVEDWLDAQEGQVTREDIAAFVRGSQIQITEEWQAGEEPQSPILIVEVDYGNPIEPDWEGEADVWLDDAHDALREEYEANGDDPADITEEDIQDRAEQIARENWSEDDAEYPAFVYDDRTGDGVAAGTFSRQAGHSFPDLDVQNGKDEDVKEAAFRRLEDDGDLDPRVTGPARFSEYTERGGENYREILLRVPNLHLTGKNREDGKHPFVQSQHFEQENIVVHARVKDRRGPDGEKVLFVEEIQSDLASKWRENSESPEVTARRRELQEQIKDARAALGEANNALEDYAQTVRERPAFRDLSRGATEDSAHLLVEYVRGTRSAPTQGIQAFYDTLERDTRFNDLMEARDEAKLKYDSIERDILALGTERSMDPSIPDTPFQQEHTYNLMVKRLVRMAAEEGYDRLSWTPGYMQAERWDKAGQSVVEDVEWSAPDGESIRAAQQGSGTDLSGYRYVNLAMAGSGNVIDMTVDPNGKVEGTAFEQFQGKQLSQIVGPGVAKQIMSESSGSVSGQKITFPDSGYAIAYDQQTRKAVDKLVKKHGARVYQDKTLPDMESGDMLPREGLGRAPDPSRPGDWAADVRPVWSVDITDKLRSAALEPMPLLQAPIPGAPHVTPAVAKSALPRLRREIDRLNLQRVRVALDESRDNRQGAFVHSPYGAMDILIGQSLDVDKTLYHESLHAMRHLDLFTPNEWDALTKAAENDWLARHDIAARYPNLNRDEQIEEAIAEAFADHAARKKPPREGALIRAFNKIHRLMRAIRTAFKGLDADEVFMRAHAGEIGARTAANTGYVADVRRVRAQAQPGQQPAQQPAPKGPGPILGAPYIPDRRVWDELAAVNRPIWQRLKGGAGAARDALDRARFHVQDRMLPLLRAQQAIERASGEPLPDHLNAYLVEETFAGRAGRHLDDIDRERTEPIINIIARTKGLTADIVGDWLTARHAKERNKRIAQINKEMPDGGSGMTNAQADRILRELRAAPYADQLEQISAIIADLRKRTMDLRVDAGLISREDADTLMASYKHYVPLKGFAETDFAEAELDARGVGRRYSVRGRESQRTLGRRSRSFNPLMGMIVQAQETAIRAEKNRVARAVYDLAAEFPSDKLWQIKGVKQKRVFNRTTGMVERIPEGPITPQLEPNEMAVKVDGVEKRILFKDDRLTAALGQVGADQMHPAIAVAAGFNRFLSTMITTLDPEFIIRNAFRDGLAAQINVGSFVQTKADIAAIRKSMAKNWGKAWMGAAGGLAGREKTEWERHFREFTEAGAKVHFFHMETPEAGMTDMERRIRLSTGPAPLRALKVAASPRALLSKRDNKALGFVERMNLATDNAIRLAAFVEARKLGWSKQQAASLARNLTVNFNRRGAQTGWLNAMFLFFNAAVQGLHVTAKAVTTKRGMTAVGILMGYGAAKEFLNAALSGDEDDDGVKDYDEIPAWKRRMNDIWIMDGERAITIPLPYIYAVFPYMGQQAARVARGQANSAEAVGEVFITTLQQSSPIGMTEGFGGILPTALQPGYEMATNQDWLGRPIRPEAHYADYGPNAYKYYSSVSEASKEIADFINRGTGGSASEPGGLDISPEYIDHTVGFLFGGAGRFVGRSADLVAKVASGEPTDPRDWPLARQVHYELGPWLDRSRFYDNTERVRAAHKQVKLAKEAGEPVTREQALLASLYTEANRLRRQMSDLNDKVAVTRGIQGLTAEARRKQLEALEKQRELIYRKLNRRIAAADRKLK